MDEADSASRVEETRYFIGTCLKGARLGVMTEGVHDSDNDFPGIHCPLHQYEIMHLRRVDEDEYVRFCRDADDG